ncbi:MAG: reverse transcriptase domain-containing protein, partial [Dysgonamonadaceae bacterium]|nr:reverse transcriptase domain-containing protein [Dysgonamonadaceae bacterium]
IPQGSPISATLANLYMLDFDKQADDMLKNIGGVYQRYSDDMVAIFPVEFEEEIVNHFLSSILTYKLEVQKSKTQAFHFIYDKHAERHFCFEKNLNTNRLQDNTLFEYLGFQFDGYSTLIKNSSISNYYRKMKRTFARSRFYTHHNRTTSKGQVFKTRLYKKFTHVGANRRRIYQRHPNKSDVFILSHRYDWGNFITYVKLAEKTISDNKINGQLKRHWKKFHELMDKIEEK